MLDINVYMIIGQVLTFLAGLAILWRIAYRPVVRIFKQRATRLPFFPFGGSGGLRPPAAGGLFPLFLSPLPLRIRHLEK